MKATVGKLLLLTGIVLFGVTSIVRYRMTPQDWLDLGLERSVMLIPLFGSIALVVAGYYLQDQKKATPKK